MLVDGRPGVEPRVLVEELAVEDLEVATGVDPQLVDEQPAGVLVGAQRLGLATAAVERHHELAAEPFPQRVLGDEGREGGRRAGMVSGGQARLDAVLLGRRPQLVQPADGDGGERLEGEVGQRRSPPEGQRLVEDGAGAVGVAGCQPARPSPARRSNR